MYWEGKDVDQDQIQALKWYQRAAQNGHREAQVRMAKLYGAGHDVQQDISARRNGMREPLTRAMLAHKYG